MFTAKELESYRWRLQALAARLSGDVSQLTKESHQGVGGEPAGQLSHVPIHTSDIAAEEEQEDTTLGLLENEEHLLAETQAALDRLAQSMFGICEACGNAIAKARLHALPYSRYCVDCARRQQASGR